MVTFTDFRTSIKIISDDRAELYLPDGTRVASGSHSHCRDVRFYWEKFLRDRDVVQLSLDFD